MMPLVNAFSFLGVVNTFRIVWIGGRYGGGKTSLAFAVAAHLLEKEGYRYLLTNCRTPWADRPEDVVFRADDEGFQRFADSVILLDEGGAFLHYQKDANSFLKFLRKMNIVLIIPSFDEPTRKLRNVAVQRLMNFEVIGLPLWLYSYVLSYGRQKDIVPFGWLNPAEIYGVYHSGSTPIDDNGVADWVQEHSDRLVDYEIKQQHARGQRTTKYRGITELQRELPRLEGFGGEVGIIQEAVSELGDTLSLPEIRTKRGR